MIQIRKSSERGHVDMGWLNTYHSFSFATYQDPKFMGFSSLRVINEDFVQPADGFDTHGHHDMEIITYILEGALEHKDSMGTGSVIRPGDVQYMSAGTGVTHSEFNHSKTELVHLLQIWILPDAKGHKPRYDQKHFDPKELQGKLRLVASKDGAQNSISVHQDMKLFASKLNSKETTEYTLNPKRNGWIQVARGSIELNDSKLKAGDGAAISQETMLKFKGLEDGSEFLFFDLD